MSFVFEEVPIGRLGTGGHIIPSAVCALLEAHPKPGYRVCGFHIVDQSLVIFYEEAPGPNMSLFQTLFGRSA